MRREKDECTFCRNDFPYDFQLISNAPRYWLFVLNMNPQSDFHCLLVLKAALMKTIGHISDLGDRRLPGDVMKELGLLMNKASIAIRSSDQTIKKVFLASLNTGSKSKHIHVHLIPKRKGEKVRTVNNPYDEGGGLFFLARKEIVVDTLREFIESTTGSTRLKDAIARSTKAKLVRNSRILKANFDRIWN